MVTNSAVWMLWTITCGRFFGNGSATSSGSPARSKVPVGEVEIALEVLEHDRHRAALVHDQGDVLAVRDGCDAVAAEQVVQRHDDEVEQALEPGLGPSPLSSISASASGRPAGVALVQRGESISARSPGAACRPLSRQIGAQCSRYW